MKTINKSHSSKNLHIINSSNSYLNLINDNNNNNNFSNYGSNLISENNIGENSSLLNPKFNNNSEQEKQKIVLRCENSEDFYVAKNKKKIKLRKKEVKVNIKNQTNNTTRNPNNYCNSYSNNKKNLDEYNIKDTINLDLNVIDANKPIAYFNIDAISEGDQIKFK